MAPTSPSSPRTATLFAAKLALVGGAFSAAYAASLPVWANVVAGSLAALLLLVVLSRNPARHLGTAVGLLATAPFLYFAAEAGLHARVTSEPLGCACTFCLDDLTLSDIAQFPFSKPDGAYALAALIGFPLLGTIGYLVASALLRVRSSLASPIRAWSGLALRFASLSSLALAAALLVHACVRAQRHPTPDSYIPSLPIMGVLPPAQGEPSQVLDRLGKWPATLHIYKDHVDGLFIERSCNVATGLCEVSIGPRSCRNLFERSAAVTVRRDVRGGFIALDDGAHRFAFFEGAPRPITAKVLADVTSPPRGWIALGIVGMLVAVWVQARRIRTRKRVERLAGARGGSLGEDGWIVPEDGQPAFRVEPGLGIPAGPVLILSGAPRPGAAYRGGQSAEAAVEIVAGSRDDLIDETRRGMAALDVYAAAAAWLGIAPLMTAVI